MHLLPLGLCCCPPPAGAACLKRPPCTGSLLLGAPKQVLRPEQDRQWQAEGTAGGAERAAGRSPLQLEPPLAASLHLAPAESKSLGEASVQAEIKPSRVAHVPPQEERRQLLPGNKGQRVGSSKALPWRALPPPPSLRPSLPRLLPPRSLQQHRILPAQEKIGVAQKFSFLALPGAFLAEATPSPIPLPSPSGFGQASQPTNAGPSRCVNSTWPQVIPAEVLPAPGEKEGGRLPQQFAREVRGP